MTADFALGILCGFLFALIAVCIGALIERTRHQQRPHAHS